MNVKSILAAKGGNVLCLKPDVSIKAFARFLAVCKVGAAVFTSDGTMSGELRGICTERDLARYVAESDDLSRLIDETIMTTDVRTCSEDDTVAEIMAKMTARKFRHLPVLSKGKLVGLVSIGDVVKAHVDQIEAEATAMRDYIGGIT